jgi:hypothetical protein
MKPTSKANLSKRSRARTVNLSRNAKRGRELFTASFQLLDLFSAGRAALYFLARPNLVRESRSDAMNSPSNSVSAGD